MMYQLPIDMITRMMSVPRETKSPPFQRASRPYGFSTTSLSAAGGGGCGVGAAALAASGAGAGAAALAAGCASPPVAAWASAGAGASARPAAQATRIAAARAGSRLNGFMGILLFWRALGERGRSVLEVEDDFVLADEADGFGVELPLRQGADDFTVEDPVGRAADLHVRHVSGGCHVHPRHHSAVDAAPDGVAR